MAKAKLIREVKDAYNIKLEKYKDMLNVLSEKQKRSLYCSLLKETETEIRLQYGTLHCEKFRKVGD